MKLRELDWAARARQLENANNGVFIVAQMPSTEKLKHLRSVSLLK